MPFIKRKNTHQVHFEDLVLLGPDGLEELDDKIEGALERIQDSNSSRLNITTKIDGSPALFVYHTYPGYPDNGIALKGFVNGPQNVMTSREAIDQKYPSDDRSGMRQMLYYGLELAKCIPDGECWQGDCLFTSDSKKEENILGTDYITFQPNKIIYAFSEGQSGYNGVKNADFGICFHTIYTGDDYHQSFKCDPTRLNNVPSNFYIMSPVLESNSNNFNINKLKTVVDRFQKLENQLLSNKAYEPLVNNSVFMSYWNTFENANLADKQQININENTFIKELKEYISQKVQKDIDKLKTERGKANVRQKLEDLQNLIDNNISVLTLLVKTLNAAANIKMLLWEGFRQSKPSYSTFYKSKTKGHFGADMEGIAVSDQAGNIVKIVDRSKFSSYNRDPDIESGWEHNESLIENYESMVNSGEPIMAINFGRMSVPTIGHLRLVKYMASISKGVKARLYLSHQQMNKDNPLSYESKLEWCKKAFGDIVDVTRAESANLFENLRELSIVDGYQGNVIYCCGSDRAEKVKAWPLKRDEEGNVYYKDKQGNLIFKFKDFDIMILDRIEGGSAEESVSGAQVRQCVLDDDFESFAKLVPFNEEDAEELFEEIRNFYQSNGFLTEQLNEAEEKTFNKERDFKTKNINSFKAAYDLLLQDISAGRKEDDPLVSQVKNAIADIERITNSIDVNILNKLSKRLESTKAGFTPIGFIKQFNPTEDDLDKLSANDGLKMTSQLDLNTLHFSDSFLNELIKFKGGDKKSTTNIGPYEFALALLFKGGSMETVGTNAGDISIDGKNVEVKGTNNPAAIGVDTGDTMDIIKAFDDYVFTNIEGGQKNKVRRAINSSSYNEIIDLSAKSLPEKLKPIIKATDKISFKDLFNSVFKYLIDDYAKRFDYLAICKKHMVYIIPSSNASTELLSGKYTVTFTDYVFGRCFKIYRKG